MKQLDSTLTIKDNYGSSFISPPKGSDFSELEKDKDRKDLDPKEIEKETKRLMADYDVTAKKNIYLYLLGADEKVLNIRAFDERDKRTIYEQQDGICPYCKESFEYSEMEGDHKVPWSKGGKSKIENLEMVCKECNQKKSNNLYKSKEESQEEKI